MNLHEIKKSVGELPLRELVKLDAWLRKLINTTTAQKNEHATAEPAASRAGRATGKTYRLEGVRCGNKNCKCAAGQLHGPYWYAYWSEGGKTKSQYVGKKLPEP